MLEDTSVDLLPWFKNNGMQANANKSHLLVNSKEKLCAKVGPCDIQRGYLSIDDKLAFEKG